MELEKACAPFQLSQDSLDLSFKNPQTFTGPFFFFFFSLSLSLSQGSGFFYVFADTPLGLSKNEPWIVETSPNNSAQYYPLKEFSDNIAHSNFRVSCTGIRRPDTLVILFLRINEDFCDNFVA